MLWCVVLDCLQNFLKSHLNFYSCCCFLFVGFCCPKYGYQIGYRTLYKLQKWLFGDGHERKIHPAGTTSYPCRVTLPASIPSSLESSIGHIRHIIEGQFPKDARNCFERKLHGKLLSFASLENVPLNFFNSRIIF